MLLANIRKSFAFAINLSLVTSALITLSITNFPPINHHANVTVLYTDSYFCF